MSDGFIDMDESGEKIGLTVSGAQAAVEIMRLYKEGYNQQDICETLGIPYENEDYTSLRILVALADMSGLYDDPVIEKYINNEPI